MEGSMKGSTKRCPRWARSCDQGSPGALAGSAFIAEPNDHESGAESAGVLHDQQTLDGTTVTHGHLLRFG